MYIDIPANDNLAEPAMATFKETGASRRVRGVKLHIDGAWRWCAVTGWGEDGAEPALASPIEESGDGPAILVHGGAHGLRLAPLADRVAWSVDDAAQWGEAFLLCRPETEFVDG